MYHDTTKAKIHEVLDFWSNCQDFGYQRFQVNHILVWSLFSIFTVVPKSLLQTKIKIKLSIWPFKCYLTTGS